MKFIAPLLLLISLLAMANAAEGETVEADKFSLLIARAQSMPVAREQAIIASGIVRVDCRIVNELGTYLIYCGKSSSEDELQSELQRLIKLGFTDIEINTGQIWDYRVNELNDIKASLDSLYGVSEEVANDLFSDFLKNRQNVSSPIETSDETSFNLIFLS